MSDEQGVMDEGDFRDWMIFGESRDRTRVDVADSERDVMQSRRATAA